MKKEPPQAAPRPGPGASGTRVPRDPATGWGAAPAGTPKKGEPDSSTKARAVALAAKKTAGGVKSVLLWVVPIAAAAVALYLIFASGKAPAEVRTPDATMMTYTSTIRMYVPPSNRSPSDDAVDTWLNFFDGPSRLWFNDNVDKLSFISNQNQPDVWKDWKPAKRRSEAMTFLLTQPPLGGIVKTVSAYNNEKEHTAQIEVQAGSRQYSFSMIEKNGRWQFQDMMGKQQPLNQLLQPLSPPRG